MTLKKLASEIAKREGKKSQARIGDIREIIGIICDLTFEGNIIGFFADCYEHGKKRAKRKTKGKKR